MTGIPSAGAFAIVPCNDLAAALPFWKQMGFEQTGGDSIYVILTGWDCEVHLRRGDPPPWHVPENNPFGVFIRTPHVDEIARLMDEYVARPGGVLATASGASTKSRSADPTTCSFGSAGRRT